MRKRRDHTSNLFTIGLLAPVVAGTRLQMMGMRLARPTAKSRREMVRMTAEKPATAMEGAVAAQKAMLDSGLKLWSDTALAATEMLVGGPMNLAGPATAAVRRRVRANARRLTGI